MMSYIAVILPCKCSVILTLARSVGEQSNVGYFMRAVIFSRMFYQSPPAVLISFRMHPRSVIRNDCCSEYLAVIRTRWQVHGTPRTMVLEMVMETIEGDHYGNKMRWTDDINTDDHTQTLVLILVCSSSVIIDWC